MSEAFAERLLRWMNCTCFVLASKFFFCPDYALDITRTKMVNKSGQAGAFSDIERIIEDEKLAIGEMIYLCTEYLETGVEWRDLDDSAMQHYAMIAERINALVCKLARSSLARPTTAV
ncbi:MAG: hypothetical protein WBE80_10290 [Methylocella sp.]